MSQAGQPVAMRWLRRETCGAAARFAAYSAGQAAVVAHVAEHELGRPRMRSRRLARVLVRLGAEAAREPSVAGNASSSGPIRRLVLEDQRRRNATAG